MRVRVLAFARVREVLGFGERDVDVAAGATLDGLWTQLIERSSQAAGLRGSTRFARNGVLADGGVLLAEGDEVALMPPVGGG